MVRVNAQQHNRRCHPTDWISLQKNVFSILVVIAIIISLPFLRDNDNDASGGASTSVVESSGSLSIVRKEKLGGASSNMENNGSLSIVRKKEHLSSPSSLVLLSNKNLLPQRKLFGDREVVWQFPTAKNPKRTKHGASARCLHLMRGVLVLYHGCNRRAMSFFYSPQGYDMMQTALGSGFAVVTVTKQRDTGCWNTGSDLRPTVQALTSWIREELLPFCDNHDGNDNNHNSDGLPYFFGFGASSGGDFVAQVAREQQQASSTATDPGHYFSLSAMNVQITEPRRARDISIPTYFTIMSRDPRTKKGVLEASKFLKDEKKIPVQILQTEPKPISKNYFSDRFRSKDNRRRTISEEASERIFRELQTLRACCTKEEDNGESLFLSKNPRSVGLDGILQQQNNNNDDSLSAYGVSPGLWEILTEEERQDANRLWLEEELNVLYDQHEITAEGFHDVLRFFLEHTNSQ